MVGDFYACREAFMKFAKLILLSFFIYFSSYSMFSNVFEDSSRSFILLDSEDEFSFISKKSIIPRYDFEFYLYQIFDTFLSSHSEDENYALSLEQINDMYKQNMYSSVSDRESIMKFVIDHKIIPLVRLFHFLGMDKFLTFKERRYFDDLDDDPIKRVYSILNLNRISQSEAFSLCFGQIIKYDFYNLLEKYSYLLNVKIIDQLLAIIKLNKQNQDNIKKIIKRLKEIKKEVSSRKSFWRR